MTIFSCLEAIASMVFNVLLFFFLANKHRRYKVNRHQKGAELIMCSMYLANIFYSIASTFNLLAIIICGDCVLSAWIFQGLNMMIGSCFIIQFAHFVILALERIISIKLAECHQEFKLNLIVMNLSLVWLVSMVPILLFKPNDVTFLMASAILMLILDCVVMAIMMYNIKWLRKLAKQTKQTKMPPKEIVWIGKSTALSCTCILLHTLCNIPLIGHVLMKPANQLHMYNGDTTTMSIASIVLLQTLIDPVVYIFRHHIFYFYNLHLFLIGPAEVESSNESEPEESSCYGESDRSEATDKTSGRGSLLSSRSISHDVLSTTVFV